MSGQPFDDERQERFDRIVHDYYRSAESGEQIDRTEFLEKHPEFRAELISFFADLKHLGQSFEDPERPPATRLNETRLSSREERLPSPKSSIKYIGEYRITDEIERGGMGVVFKARQEKLRRTVALKMILLGRFATHSDVERFRREARAAATLQHPNIVGVHEIGTHEGHPYYTMDFVESESLAKRLRRGSLAVRESACLVGTLARATQFAHEKGVLHRDLKPGNILIDGKGTPHITDFGLAKSIGVDAWDTMDDLTQTGQIIGTPSYMSPEQAAAKHNLVSVASDVYSLGAILYACLTGRAPFVGESTIETLRQLIDDEPVSLRTLNPKLPRDLENVCHKCLQKDPHKRYATAADLADDLDRYLDGRPVVARQTGLATRMWKWSRRRPDVAILLATLAIAVLIGLSTVGVLWRTAESQRWQAEQSERKAKQNLYESWLQQAQAIRMARRSGYRDVVWHLLKQAEQLNGVERDGERVRREAVACLGDFVGLTPLSIEGPVLKNASGVSAFLDEDALAVADAHGEVFVRNLSTGKEQSRLFRVGHAVVAIKSTPDGRCLILADATGIESWTRSLGGNWTQAWRTTGGYPSLFMDLDVAADRVAIIRNQRIELLNLDDGSTVHEFGPDNYSFLFPRKGFLTTAISPDGRLVAAADDPASVFVWDVASGQLFKRIVAPGTGIPNLVFTRDSTQLILGTDTGVVSYECENFTQRSAFQTEPIRSLSVSPEGGHLLLQSDAGTVQLWNLRTLRLIAQLAHSASGQLGSTGFSPEGTRFFAAGAGHLRIWNFAGTPEKLVIRGHREPVSCVAIHPSQPLLASGSHDGWILFHDIRTGDENSKVHLDAPIEAITFSPDGVHFAAVTTHALSVWQISDAGEHTLILSTEKEYRAFNDLCFGSGGRWMATCGGAGVQLWKISPGTGTTPSEFRLHKRFHSFFKTAEFDSTGRYLALTRPKARGWIDLLAPKLKLVSSAAADFSSDLSGNGAAGEFCVIVSQGRLQHWVLPSDRLIGDGIAARRLNSTIVAAAPSSGLLAAKSGSSSLAIFALDTHASLFTLADERSAINSFCWDASGSKLAVGLADGSISLWDFRVIERQLHLAGLSAEPSLFRDTAATSPELPLQPVANRIPKLQQQVWESTEQTELDQRRAAQLLEQWGLEPERIGNDSDSSAVETATDPVAIKLRDAGGGLAETGAFAIELDRTTFRELDKQLQSRGYRVQTISPYRIGTNHWMAAGWKRETLKTVTEFGLTLQRYSSLHQQLTRDGFQLIDLGGYVEGPVQAERFYAIWQHDQTHRVKQEVVLESTIEQTRERFAEMYFDHEPVLRQVYFDAQGQQRFCEVWEKFPELWLPRWTAFTNDLANKANSVERRDYDRTPITYFNIARNPNSNEVQYSGVWRTDAVDLLARRVEAVAPRVVTSMGRAMLKAGYHPACLSLTSASTDDVLAAAVWHRSDANAESVHPAAGERQWPKVSGSCRIEGEEFYFTSNSGSVVRQPMDSFSSGSWSGNRQLLWTDSPLGKRLDLAFEVTHEGNYELVAYLTTAYDFGVVQLYLDDRPLGPPVDLYHAGGEFEPELTRVPLGQHAFEKCAHRIRVELVGSHRDAAPSHGFGIDYVEFTAKRPPG